MILHQLADIKGKLVSELNPNIYKKMNNGGLSEEELLHYCFYYNIKYKKNKKE